MQSTVVAIFFTITICSADDLVDCHVHTTIDPALSTASLSLLIIVIQVPMDRKDIGEFELEGA